MAGASGAYAHWALPGLVSGPGARFRVVTRSCRFLTVGAVLTGAITDRMRSAVFMVVAAIMVLLIVIQVATAAPTQDT